jgi:hypothetical protein
MSARVQIGVLFAAWYVHALAEMRPLEETHCTAQQLNASVKAPAIPHVPCPDDGRATPLKIVGGDGLPPAPTSSDALWSMIEENTRQQHEAAIFAMHTQQRGSNAVFFPQTRAAYSAAIVPAIAVRIAS